MNVKSTTQLQGKKAEDFALDFLSQQKMTCITRNFYSKSGEIDLVMKDQEFLIFVEVRYRRSQTYGSALSTVDWRKQQKIIKTANYFLLKNPHYQTLPARFDVVGISGNSMQAEWIKNAFQVN
jgi:putative endonuclease